jgi:hypothetical protein
MKTNSITKSHTRSIVSAAAILMLATSTSFAGEITGNGKSLKDADGNLKGRSECAYSGREDVPGEELFPGVRLFKGLLTQSWGQLTAEAKAFFQSIGAQPGNSCNPSKSG